MFWLLTTEIPMASKLALCQARDLRDRWGFATCQFSPLHYTRKRKNCDNTLSPVARSIKNKDLGPDAREKIWRTFLGKARGTGNIDVEVDEDDTHKLSQILLNGRQVKNIMSIAQAVAAEKKVPMTLAGIRLAYGFSRLGLDG